VWRESGCCPSPCMIMNKVSSVADRPAGGPSISETPLPDFIHLTPSSTRRTRASEISRSNRASRMLLIVTERHRPYKEYRYVNIDLCMMHTERIYTKRIRTRQQSNEPFIDRQFRLARVDDPREEILYASGGKSAAEEIVNHVS